MMTLADLAYRLNDHESDDGTTFDAMVMEDGVLEVTCTGFEEFPMHLTKTETQLISVTPLFSKDEVKADSLGELHESFLRLSPALPLSSVGLQGNTFILFGAMALSTRFEVVAHELEIQAENTIDVLESVEHLLN
ncbi:MAG: DUF2170 family protein [Pseudomonadales bacterium]|nr:DUF2170 family protein [Pseudomonadales bacterium]